jgi:putative heme iron utilization protein
VRPRKLHGRIGAFYAAVPALSDLASARQDFLALRSHSSSALLATLSPGGKPNASYAPMLWLDDYCYLFLSELANHTGNLKADPSISLMLIEPEQQAANAFARQRITLQGAASVIARDEPLFAQVLSEFHRRFGGVMSVIEPLPDFHLFRIRLDSGHFIRGFGQAFRLSGEHLDELTHIRPE